MGYVVIVNDVSLFKFLFWEVGKFVAQSRDIIPQAEITVWKWKRK